MMILVVSESSFEKKMSHQALDPQAIFLSEKHILPLLLSVMFPSCFFICHLNPFRLAWRDTLKVGISQQTS